VSGGYDKLQRMDGGIVYTANADGAVLIPSSPEYSLQNQSLRNTESYIINRKSL